MKVHIIIDFMFMYYKYKNLLICGKIGRLSTTLPNGTQMDTTLLYYPIREIEMIRKEYEKAGADVTISVCFDSATARKEESTEYKGKRKKTLADDDYKMIDIIRHVLDAAGHNVYKAAGAEADDLIWCLAQGTKRQFNQVIVYTPDYDLLVNVDSNVMVRIYRQGRGYDRGVTRENFTEYTAQKKLGVPGKGLEFNSILLYKSICGDTSDNVPGIKGIGPAKYGKLLDKCRELNLINNSDFERMVDPGFVEVILIHMASNKVITEEQYKQARDSLLMVAPRVVKFMEAPNKKSTVESRTMTYSRFGMTSLI